ncbi:MAG TPA: hypothetical protein VGM27_10365 [Acidobacteriaceae bacterium]
MSGGSMLNDHTASNGASMMTSCLDLNGGRNPASKSPGGFAESRVDHGVAMQTTNRSQSA